MKDKSEDQLEEIRRGALLWTSGFIAISLVVLQAFLSANKLDIAEIISVFAFAAAIPILAICTLTINLARKRSQIDNPRMGAGVFVGASFASIGIAAALYHISFVASLIFFASIIITAFVLYFPHLFRGKE